MERFKAMEKELKTKAYSAAGLNAASKMDPEEIRKEEIRRWISDQTDTLETQIDTLEAERETLLLGSKKSKKARLSLLSTTLHINTSCRATCCNTGRLIKD